MKDLIIQNGQILSEKNEMTVNQEHSMIMLEDTLTMEILVYNLLLVKFMGMTQIFVEKVRCMNI